jgi:heme-degrading monooxygenase HmoA
MPRISLFHRMADEDAFVAGWAADRSGDGAVLLRSHSSGTDYRFAEVVPSGSPPPDLGVRGQSAQYEPIEDDLPDGASFGWVLLNGYEAAADEAGGFQAAWRELRGTVRDRPGFVGARLHRTADPAAPFAYVTFAAWETLEQLTAGVAGQAFADRAATLFRDAHPAVFEVVR